MKSSAVVFPILDDCCLPYAYPSNYWSSYLNFILFHITGEFR